MYVIWNGTNDDDWEELFWSNENGWVNFPSATLFTEEEKEKFNLPEQGIWVHSPF